MEHWTIQKLLTWTTQYFTDKGIDSPRLSAEMLLSHVLGIDRIALYTDFDKVVSEQKRTALRELVKRAAGSEPIQYLIGKTEFYSMGFEVCPDCLIPRPETELLIERAIEFLRTRNGKQAVCDLCTGCGCIAIAIAKNYSDARIVATDISDAALAVAARNIQTHQLSEKINLIQGDLFEPLIPQIDQYQFDLIVCNPPYVSSGEYEKLDANVRNYEPKIALHAGTEGLDIYRRICDKMGDFLKPDASVILEIGYAQGPAVRQLLQETGLFAEISIEKDFHDNDRVIIANRETAGNP